jgi:hypothetical protein
MDEADHLLEVVDIRLYLLRFGVEHLDHFEQFIITVESLDL